MSLSLPLLVTLRLLISLASMVQEPEVRREYRADGSLASEVQVLRDSSGKEVRDGTYRAFFESGTLRTEGHFANDRRSGHWTFYHENGEVAEQGNYVRGARVKTWRSYHENGAERSKGRYSKGIRKGKWSFWLEDGSVDPVHTGTYSFLTYRSRDGGRHFEGPLLDGSKHGRWTSYWRTGERQLQASFARGVRAGEWVFFHQDGTPSESLLTGIYAEDRWVSPLATDLVETRGDLSGIPSPATLPATFDEEAILAEVDAVIEADEGEAARLLSRLQAAPPWEAERVAVVPLVVRRMLRCDAETPEGRRTIGRLDALLRSAAFGNGWPRSSSEELRGPAARELVRCWASLSAVAGHDSWLWWVELPRGERRASLADGRSALQEPDLLAVVDPLEDGARALPGVFRERLRDREDHRKELGGAWIQALRDALQWLARHQSPDGSWRSASFVDNCGKIGPNACEGTGGAYDVGVTGLALLAYLGDGNSGTYGPYREVVARSVAWLLGQQDEQGRIRTVTRRTESDGAVSLWYSSDWLYEHAIATTALCEVVAMMGGDRTRGPLQRAIDVIHRARNPYGAWRYQVPPIGDSDTSVTSWMVQALCAARHADLRVDPAALEGALSWIDEVSDPATGRIGYDSFGSPSARSTVNEHYPREKGEAMTAAGLLCRMLLGQSRDDSEIVRRHADLIVRTLPAWDVAGFGCDMYYWCHGTQAIFLAGGSHWKRWEKALRPAILDQQRQDGDEKGSWDPVGPWGYQGGRIYSTALMALSLEAPFRYADIPGAR